MRQLAFAQIAVHAWEGLEGWRQPSSFCVTNGCYHSLDRDSSDGVAGLMCAGC